MTAHNQTILTRASLGQHLVLDFNGCPKELLANKENILNWSKELVDAIDMVAFVEPVLEHFATHSHEAADYTLLQMIETSNIAAYFAENIGQAYIDVFSFKAFDVDLVVEICKRHFNPTQVHTYTKHRGFHQENKVRVATYQGSQDVRTA